MSSIIKKLSSRVKTNGCRMLQSGARSGDHDSL
ncbi:Uncharacterised protein [Mycobacteroides abscessus subsp. massiliense]|nr:Uncharacterised protein [Mycobacteroides abscessus subsp. massiliense]